MDETRQRRGHARADLAWENVTAKSGYLRGIEPKRGLRNRISSVTLAPGQCVEFFVPANELVRVVSYDSVQLPQRVQIWTSNGSGLYRKHNAAVTPDGCSLIAAPDQSSISLAKVCRPTNTTGSVCVAIYTSRRHAPKLLDYYRCPILQCGQQVEIKDDRGSPARHYSLLAAGTSKSLQVSGPRRLRIESRLKYGLDVQPSQPYWLQVYVDGVLHRVLTFTTQPNRDHRVFVDGCEQLVGRREFSYLDLDCGDRKVEIRTTSNAYVSVNAIGLDLCRPDLNRSFAFPNAENIRQAFSLWDTTQTNHRPVVIEDSFLRHPPGHWDHAETPMMGMPLGGESVLTLNASQPHTPVNELASHPSPDPLWDPYLNQQRIIQLARNNRIPHGGLRAYMWMRAIATRHRDEADFGDEISIAELTSRMREHTFYQDLLPTNNQGDQRSIAFINPRIRRPDQSAAEVIVGEQHLPNAIANVPSATICQLSTGSESALVHDVPESIGTSLIRVVVDQTRLQNNLCLMVQFDDAQPIQLAVDARDPIKAGCYAPDRASAALSCLSSVHQRYDSGTAGGPFAMWNRPNPLTRVATCEFLKPAHVRTIRTWIGSCEVATAYVGLQYLDAKPSKLPETAFRSLNAIVDHEGDTSPLGMFAQQEINNDSLGIERLLRSNYEWFVSTIAPSSELTAVTEIWDDETLSQTARDANQLTSQGLLPEAIAAWTRIVRHSNGTQRRQAILARADALFESGETLLAQREWRGWLQYSDDPALQTQCVDRLLTAAGDDQRLRESILSFAAIEEKEDHFTRQLARQFMHNGRYRFALLMLSSMPADEQTRDILLRCSFQTQWWGLFDQTVASVRDPQAKNFWAGLKELKLGRYEHARRLFASGGLDGARWLEHWKTGDQIFGSLTSSIRANRLSALGDWENWQHSHPGQHIWVDEPTAVRSPASTRWMHLDQRGLQLATAHTNPDQPAIVSLHGPVRVRLEIRPTHINADSEPINDWILLQHGGELKRVPIIENRVSMTSAYPNKNGERPGQVETIELDLPAGWNQFQVHCEQSSFAMNVSALRPEIPFPTLPFINETTVLSIVDGSFGRHKHACNSAPHESKKTQCSDCVRMTCRDQQCRSIPLSFDTALRFEKAPCSCSGRPAPERTLDQLPDEHRLMWQNRILPTQQTVQMLGGDALYDDAVALLLRSRQATRPRDTLSSIVALHRIVEANPRREEIRQILESLMSQTKWDSFRQFDARAGVHSLQVHGWTPNSPEARVVAALLGDDISAEVLSGTQQLTLMMNSPASTEIEVILQRPRLGFSPTGATTVVLEGRSRSQTITLDDPDKKTVARLTMGAGPHTLQISQANPLANHFVMVDLNEVLPDGSVVPIDNDKIRMKQKLQTYQVATADEPLKFRVAGPTLLRIDRNENGIRTHQYLAVEGEKSYALEPSVGSDSALLRIYQLKLDDYSTPAFRSHPNPPESPDLWADQIVQAAYQSVDATNEIATLDQLAMRAPDMLPLTLQLQNPGQFGGVDLGLKPLGTQKRGTVAVDAGFRQRDAVEEFNNIANTERFFETKVSRYQYDHWHDRYRANHVLARVRADGGPSLGWIHEGASTYPLDACESDSRCDGWGDLQFNYKAFAFAQFGGDRILNTVSETPWSLGVSARLSRRHELSPTMHHQPSVSLFGRTLSDNRNGFASGELDQDVFTQYKSDHRQGLRFSDRLVYQSCLDRRYWVSPSLTTNADELSPDNVGIQFGTDHLLGPLQFQLAYRITGYLSDNRRNEASLQNVLYLDLVLETWHTRTRRSEIAFSMRNDFDSGRSSVGINFVSFINHSRGYRDLRPGTTLFRSIRQERAAKHYGSIR